MIKAVLATCNKHKVTELKAMLADQLPELEIISLADVEKYDGAEIEENGTTFEENAMIKAGFAASFGYIGIGDDSGLAVEALDGAPGIFSARYAGAHGDDKGNNEKLLRELADKDNRRAKFVCAIACAMPDGRSFTVRGEVEGEIGFEYAGHGGFGYDPLFVYKPFGKSFGELTAEEKNSVSHRRRAIDALAVELKKYI